MHQFDLKNRTAIITGGAQGFGLDIAKRFLNSGAKAIIWDIDEDELKKVTKEINNPNLSYNIVDISNFKNLFAISRPKPCAPPVIIAVLFFKSNWCIKTIY